MAVIQFIKSDPRIGIVVRPTRAGPEMDLALQYLAKESAVLDKKQNSYAIFLEPQLDTGFPDLVVVTFNSRTFTQWPDARNNLTNIDIKILHHMHFKGSVDEISVRYQLGLNKQSILRSFSALQAAGLVRFSAKRWIPYGLRKSFGVSSIKAIEVKIKNWKDAFEQARMNHWFASESYILLPTPNPTDKIREAVRSFGIGLYAMPNGYSPKNICKATKTSLPVSYASWLFNEWIGRHLNR